MKKLIPLLFVAVLLVGCMGGGTSQNGTPAGTAGVDAGLRAFEKASNIVNDQGEYDIAWAKENILKLSYNEPSNPFWTLTMWYQTERYIFKDWVVSLDGNTASVVLTYSTINSVDGTESPEYRKTFTMQKFGDVWRVNLAEFLKLD